VLQEGHKLTNPDWPAYQIPYFDLDGKPSKFFRVRFLAPPSKGWASVAVKEKPLRYTQPAGTKPEPYLPPLPSKMTWRDLAADPQRDLIITEGEKKAAALTLCCAMPAIGLGGVFNFKSKDCALLPTLEEFVWRGRVVRICFDSDRLINTDIQLAASRLAAQLFHREARVFIMTPPPGPNGERVAIDDYLALHGEEAVRELANKSEEDIAAGMVRELNEEVFYVRSVCAVVKRDTSQVMSRDNFSKMAYANRRYPDMKGHMHSAAEEWLQWPGRAEVGDIIYEPGGEKLVQPGNFNQWPGWGCKPEKRDIGPWKWLLDWLTAGLSAEHKQWLVQWMAWPLQHPGAKLAQAVILIGRHGVGKNLLGETMRPIYGSNFALVNSGDITDNYNDWVVRKQFIVGDEILVPRERHNMVDALKTMVTRTQVRVKEKYQPSYVIRDCANYLLTTNHDVPVRVEDGERRYFVVRIQNGPAEQQCYRDYGKWLAEGGAAGLFHYLLNEVDLAGFDPQAHAPQTESYKDLVNDSRSEIDAFAYAAATDPASVGLDKELYTLNDLLRAYEQVSGTADSKWKPTPRQMVRALRSRGLDPIDGNHTHDLQGNRVYMYAINSARKNKFSRGTVSDAVAASRAYAQQQNQSAPKFTLRKKP
jgi:hypothetical protein